MTKSLLNISTGLNHFVTLEFKLADMWIGVYWTKDPNPTFKWFHIWVCIFPCFPIHIEIAQKGYWIKNYHD